MFRYQLKADTHTQLNGFPFIIHKQVEIFRKCVRGIAIIGEIQMIKTVRSRAEVTACESGKLCFRVLYSY